MGIEFSDLVVESGVVRCMIVVVFTCDSGKTLIIHM